LKILAVLALAVAFCAPAFAETQTVKVSGALDAYWFYRHNLDLRDGNDSGAIPESFTVPASPVQGSGSSSPTANGRNQSDGDNYFMSIAQIEVAADLTDNVSVVIRLLNQRDWNADAFRSSQQETAEPEGTVGIGSENDEDEFDVVVDLAYVQMKEIFYAPLTLTIGRQDLWFGRGFVLGANYQDHNNSIQADEFTGTLAFDAARATLDFAPWTLDFVFASIDENRHDPEDDRHFWWVNVNYQFAEYNAEAEVYGMADVDKATLASAATGSALTVDTPRTSADNVTYMLGTRAQFDPIPQITLGGEIAWQFGDYFSSAAAIERDRSALGGELFGEYRFDNQWKPMIGLQYVFFSGDAGTSTTDDYDAWNGLFRGPTYGDIRDWQEVFYETALAVDQPAGTNQQHFAIYSSIMPLEDMKIDGFFYWFWTDEDIISGATTLEQDIGNELDIHVTYNYTEDVTFGTWLAWFWPGDLFDNQIGGGTAGDTDATAFQTVSSVKVAF
jgi:hypothetical protein